MNVRLLLKLNGPYLLENTLADQTQIGFFTRAHFTHTHGVGAKNADYVCLCLKFSYVEIAQQFPLSRSDKMTSAQRSVAQNIPIFMIKHMFISATDDRRTMLQHAATSSLSRWLGRYTHKKCAHKEKSVQQQQQQHTGYSARAK